MPKIQRQLFWRGEEHCCCCCCTVPAVSVVCSIINRKRQCSLQKENVCRLLVDQADRIGKKEKEAAAAAVAPLIEIDTRTTNSVQDSHTPLVSSTLLSPSKTATQHRSSQSVVSEAHISSGSHHTHRVHTDTDAVMAHS